MHPDAQGQLTRYHLAKIDLAVIVVLEADKNEVNMITHEGVRVFTTY